MIPDIEPAAAEVPETALSERMRMAFRRTVSSVAVITAADGAERTGFTASSVTSMSLDPPIITFGTSMSTRSWKLIECARHIGVQFLSSGQEWVARRFAKPGIDKFAAPLRWSMGPLGVPLLDDSLFTLLCTVGPRIHIGENRSLVVATVVHINDGENGSRPLTYGNGSFHTGA